MKRLLYFEGGSLLVTVTSQYFVTISEQIRRVVFFTAREIWKVQKNVYSPCENHKEQKKLLLHNLPHKCCILMSLNMLGDRQEVLERGDDSI